MGLSSQSEVFDPVRNLWVAATPEEIVRQLWIKKMVEELGYPKELIAVEKQVVGLNRRLDLLCYSKKKDDLKPLLLIECKAGEIGDEALSQAVGYNSAIGAPYVAVVNQNEIIFQYNLNCQLCKITKLPLYKELVDALAE